MTKFAPISWNTFGGLLTGRVLRVEHDRASLEYSKTDRKFWMHGPSGSHSLDADVTDRERLNGHWKGFATHEKNKYSAA